MLGEFNDYSGNPDWAVHQRDFADPNHAVRHQIAVARGHILNLTKVVDNADK